MSKLFIGMSLLDLRLIHDRQLIQMSLFHYGQFRRRNKLFFFSFWAHTNEGEKSYSNIMKYCYKNIIISSSKILILFIKITIIVF